MVFLLKPYSNLTCGISPFFSYFCKHAETLVLGRTVVTIYKSSLLFSCDQSLYSRGFALISKENGNIDIEHYAV